MSARSAGSEGFVGERVFQGGDPACLNRNEYGDLTCLDKHPLDPLYWCLKCHERTDGSTAASDDRFTRVEHDETMDELLDDDTITDDGDEAAVAPDDAAQQRPTLFLVMPDDAATLFGDLFQE